LAELDSSQQIQVTCAVALAFANANQNNLAKSEIARAATMLDSLDKLSKKHAYKYLIPAETLLDPASSRAFEIASAMRSSDKMLANQLITSTAKLLAERGRVDEAVRFAQVDADSFSWPIVQFELAKAFAGQGNETEAIKRVELIRNSEPNTHNLCCTVQIDGYGQIVELRAKTQRDFDDMLTAARKTLSLVSDVRAKPIAVSQMAVLLAQAGRTQEAEAILEQVPEATNASNLATSMIAIMKGWLRSGNTSAAERCARRICRIARAIEDKRESGFVVRKLGSAIQELGDLQQIDAWTEVLDGIDRIYLLLGRADFLFRPSPALQVAEKTGSSTDESRNVVQNSKAPLPPSRLDPVDAILKQNSDRYVDAGFAGWKFGTSIHDPSVRAATMENGTPPGNRAGKNKQPQQKAVLNRKWTQAKNALLYFDSDKLIGVTQVNRGPMQEQLNLVTSQFGKVPAADITTYKPIRDRNSELISGYVLSRYRFSKALVYVRVCESLGDSWIEVSAFDRAFVEGLLADEVRSRRKYLELIKDIVAGCTKPGFDWADIPGTKGFRIASFTRNAEDSDSKLRTSVLRGKQAYPFGGKFKEDQFCAVFETEDNAAHRSIAVRADLNSFPRYEPHPLLTPVLTNIWDGDGTGSLQEESQLLNCLLAQEVFPPQDQKLVRTYSAATDAVVIQGQKLTMAYDWKTAAGLVVRIVPDNSFIILTKP
jgi:tetratricopeptide (TPR) repeat protein